MATKLFEFYLFETIERISRFCIHLEDLQKQFYSDDKNNLLKDKIAFIESYEECLSKLVEIVVNITEVSKQRISKKTEKSLFINLEEINMVIKKLQQELLIHLPRPAEPVELRRFCRVIQKQILKLGKHSKSDISIYVNENTVDNSFASDPLEIYKQDDINSLIFGANRAFKKNRSYIQVDELLPNTNQSSSSKVKNIHISIPRLEAANPCHWPTLIHEVSHNLMKNDWFNNKGILNDFHDLLKKIEVNSASINGILSKINIESWLIECWCDLFACALIGPSFYFSQSANFLHSLSLNKNKDYPPNPFRLKLIAKFIEHRFRDFANDAAVQTIMNESENLLEHINYKNNYLNLNDDDELKFLFTLFNHYFIHEFFVIEKGLLNLKHKELNSLFKTIAPFVNNFDLHKINYLVDSLNSGLPIPSYREAQNGNELYEKPNYIQEIFLACWLFRNEIFKTNILNKIKKLTPTNNTPSDLIAIFKKDVVKEFYRLDQSILRSIQISEWVDLLIDDSSEPNDYLNKISLAKKDNDSQLLVDRDIFSCIVSNDIKIIPLININKQLGSTSLDIRLGTSFEVFFPNQFGVVDFTKNNTLQNLKSNSKNYNLDYLESIPINPGQFILGHSMEYVKLPNYIAADLEGRSSFARLGIEIHMTAGFVDPGFEGVLTFEIFNAGTNPVTLYPGFRIGQLRFMRIKEPVKGYSDRPAKYKGLLEHHSSLQGDDYEIQRISGANNSVK